MYCNWNNVWKNESFVNSLLELLMRDVGESTREKIQIHTQACIDRERSLALTEPQLWVLLGYECLKNVLISGTCFKFESLCETGVYEMCCERKRKGGRTPSALSAPSYKQTSAAEACLFPGRRMLLAAPAWLAVRANGVGSTMHLRDELRRLPL